MRYFLISIAVLFVCCKSQTKFPDGGFDYPLDLSSNDTNHYFYQLKDSGYLLDRMRYRSAYQVYVPFDEPNLSIKPQPQETFRLFYSEAFGDCVVLTLTQDLINVKKGDPMEVFLEDTSKLTPIENFHLKFKTRFPFDTTKLRIPHAKKYFDSLIKLYPQLLDPTYYSKLYDKSIVRSQKKLNYSVAKINLTRQQYNSLIQEINSSGFWSLPYEVKCEATPTDGFGFTLEANTHEKYKVVSIGVCGENNASKFTKACQKLIQFAKLDKEINLEF